MSSAANSWREKEEEPNDEEGRTFALFTASYGDLLPSTGKTAEALRDDHALRRLERLGGGGGGGGGDERHEKNYDTFLFRGPDFLSASFDGDGDGWYQRLVLSSTLATAIVESLEETSSQWKQIEIWHARVNDPLLQVLDSAKRRNIFHSLVLRQLDHAGSVTCPILSSFARDNPKLTHLKLQRVAIDLPCLDLLKDILATTSVSPNDEGAPNERLPSYKTHLTSFEIRNKDMRLGEGEIHVLSSGLRNNHTLKTLSLLHADLDSLFTDSLMGHPTLEELNLSRGRFTEEAIIGLGKVLQHPSCCIKTLFLDDCKILTSSGFTGHLGIDVLADALADGTCSSIINLSLQRNTASSRDLQKLMRTVYACCPNLEEIDLSQNRVERIIWNHSDILPPTTNPPDGPLQSLGEGDNASPGDSSTTVHKPGAVQRLFLNRNPIIHNNSRARSSTDNTKLEELLMDFPALGQIVKGEKSKTRFVPFSPKVHVLLSFNRITRGRIRSESRFPVSLWYPILARVPILVERQRQEMSSQTTTIPAAHENIGHARTCQANLLFLLLNRHPSQVTREACRRRTVQEETTGAILILPSVRTMATETTRQTERPKRRKHS